jgi:hypothetical protein
MEQQSSLGKLIDSLIRQEWQSLNQIEQLANFIDEHIVCDGLSARQVSRMRESEDFPSMKTIKKLSQSVPSIGILDPETICQRILLDFGAIRREQKEFQKKLSKITIVAGWSKPQALVDDELAITLAENINNNISYEFIYPSIYDHPQYIDDEEIVSEKEAREYLNQNLNNLFEVIYRKLEKLDTSDTGGITKTKNAIEKTASMIKFISTYSSNRKEEIEIPKGFPQSIWDVLDTTTKSSIKNDLSGEKERKHERESVLFWLAMPSKYVTFYNLGEQHQPKDAKYGSFLVSGKVLRGTKIKQTFKSKGWLHMRQQDYKIIEGEYEEFRKSWTEIPIDTSVVKKALS